MAYYGTYKSAAMDCRAGFLSAPLEDLKFPTAVRATCKRCGKEHSFNLDHTSIVTTKAHKQALYEKAAQSGLSTDIHIQ